MCFGHDGTLLDVVFHGCMASKNNAVRHMGDDKTGGGAQGEEDECIAVFPHRVPEEVEVSA
jgi:stress response protein SCP2